MSPFHHVVGVILFWAALIALPFAIVWWLRSLRDRPQSDEVDYD